MKSSTTSTTPDLDSDTWSNATCPDGANSNDNGGTCVDNLTPFRRTSRRSMNDEENAYQEASWGVRGNDVPGRVPLKLPSESPPGSRTVESLLHAERRIAHPPWPDLSPGNW